MKEKTEIPYKFKRLFGLYVESAGVPRRGILMRRVEKALLTILDKDDYKTHSDRVLAALAVAAGRLATVELTMFVMPLKPRSKEEEKNWVAHLNDKALTEAAHWLSVGAADRPCSSFVRCGKDHISVKDAKLLLVKLLAEYFPTATTA